MSTDRISLVSVAMLKVNFDNAKLDYLDYLRSFVRAAVEYCKLQNNPITTQNVLSYIQDNFGLHVSSQSIERVLKRLSRDGDVVREHGLYRASENFRSDGKFFERRKAAEESLNRVVGGLIEYSKMHLNVHFEQDEAVEAIAAFFSSFSLEFLRASIKGTQFQKHYDRQSKGVFSVSKYVYFSQIAGGHAFEDLVMIARSTLLANALTCPDLEVINRKFGNIAFYFDTPFIVKLLGYEGESYRSAFEQLIEVLRSLKAPLYVFEHSYPELHNVLEGGKISLTKNDGRGMVARFLRDSGASESDVILMQAQLRQKVIDAGMSWERTPSYEKWELQIDEVALKENLEKQIGHYQNSKALDHDVNSIRSIYVLRDGTRPQILEEAKAIFVTTTAPLAVAAFQFNTEAFGENEISPVINSHALANVAWLKVPISAMDLPKRELLATAYAALEPDEKLWGKYLAEAEKLERTGKITATDHELLRSSLRAREELMSLTLGEEEAFRGESVLEIVERVKLELTSEEREKRGVVEEELKRTEDALNEMRQAKEQTYIKFDLLSSKIAVKVAQGVFWLLTILFIFVFFADSTNIYWAAMLFLIHVSGGIFGYTVLGISQSFRDAIKGRVYSFLVKYFT